MEDMVLAEMKYPEMRMELIGHLQALSDINYQRDVWGDHKQCTGVKHDELDYAVHFFFDDTCLSENPAAAIGWFLKDEGEAAAIKVLVAALERVFDIYGTKLDDSVYIETPEWLDVLNAAAEARALVVG